MNTFLKITANQRLSEQESYAFIGEITEGKFNDAQIAACLAIINNRPIELQEIKGFTNALLDLSVPVKTDNECMDVCGTGGDGKNTINISTLSSFVLANMNIKIAKHGNYGISSASGSSTVMEKLGYKFHDKASQVNYELNTCNISFLHAPNFHPALKKVGPIRKALGTRTFFNMLGPLVNPAKPKFRYCGVFSHQLARTYHHYLKQTKYQYGVVFSYNGYDEICNTSNFKYFSRFNEGIYKPEDFNLKKIEPLDIFGGKNAEDAFKEFNKIAEGKGTAEHNQVIALNSAFAAQLMYKKSINELYSEAMEIIQKGLIKEKINQLIKCNHECIG